MRYYITGRVLPERAAISIPNIATQMDDGIGELSFHCDASLFSVIIDNTTLDADSARLIAQDFVSTIVSSLGFAMGCNYSVEATQVSTESKESFVYGVQNQSLPYPESNIKAVFDETAELSFDDMYLRFAIRDYLNAITSPIDCAFLCYRAIETIQNRFANDFAKDYAWKEMHELIGSNKADIKDKMQHFADAVRHGAYHNFRPTTLADRTASLLETKKIIELYKKYLLLKRQYPDVKARAVKVGH